MVVVLVVLLNGGGGGGCACELGVVWEAKQCGQGRFRGSQTDAVTVRQQLAKEANESQSKERQRAKRKWLTKNIVQKENKKRKEEKRHKERHGSLIERSSATPPIRHTHSLR
ncbi:hypothetical protein GQ42DRAFT_37177 [Ramicandelaber brevisporus]|nr:hypothetical protein GQ42DRAFT_37177 [Ramicandelaber brevisporus]